MVAPSVKPQILKVNTTFVMVKKAKSEDLPSYFFHKIFPFIRQRTRFVHLYGVMTYSRNVPVLGGDEEKMKYFQVCAATHKLCAPMRGRDIRFVLGDEKKKIFSGSRGNGHGLSTYKG